VAGIMESMKLRVGVLVLLVGASVAAAPLLEAQSLAELAKQERERRKSAKAPGRVITETDLQRRYPASEATASTGTPKAAETSSTSAKPAAKPGQPAEKTADELREERRAELQKKVDEQVKRIGEIRQTMDAAQTDLNDLSTLTFGPRRAGLMKAVEDGKAEIAKIEQAIADLEDQARREGLRVSR